MTSPSRSLALFLLSGSLAAQAPLFTEFGSGCAGTLGVPSLSAPDDLPLLGKTFTAQLSNLPANSLAIGILGLSESNLGGTPLPLDLGIIGMPGCTLYTDSRRTYSLMANGGGAIWEVDLPIGAEWIGRSFYQQAMVVDAGAGNALGLIASNAAESVIGSGTDLTISGGLTSGSRLREGDQVLIPTRIVTNQGSESSGQCYEAFFLSTDPEITGEDRYLGQLLVPSLEADASIELGEFSVIIPVEIPSGDYWIGSVVDAYDAIAEVDETNNVTASQVVLEAPDLVLLSMSNLPSDPVLPGTFVRASLQYQYANRGNVETGAFRAGLYLSYDDQINASDILLMSIDHASLPAGISGVLSSLNFLLPASSQPGHYHLGILLDRQHVVRESDESNNGSSQPFVVDGPEFLVWYAAPSIPQTIIRGSAVSLPDGGLENIGGADTGTGFDYTVYLSFDSVIDPSTDIKVRTYRRNTSLAAGASIAFPTAAQHYISPSLPAGLYWMGVYADSGFEVDERSEANNWVRWQVSVQ